MKLGEQHGPNGTWVVDIQPDGNLLVFRKEDGHVVFSIDKVVTGAVRWPPPPLPPQPDPPDPPPSVRTGRVLSDRGALVDDGGAFLALDTTLMWALWGAASDQGKLDANLAECAARGIHAVRILGMVGVEPAWEDRVIDPTHPQYWQWVDHLVDRLTHYGLRARVTVCADAQVMMPSQGDRRRFAQQWARYAEQHADRIWLLEAANEYSLNGLTSQEVAELVAVMRAETSVLVAPSAPPATWPDKPDDELTDDDRHVQAEWRTLFSTSASAVGPHFQRDDGDDGYRFARQPWEVQFTGLPLPNCWVDNEARGIQSSVAQTDDPVKLAIAALTAWQSGCGAYTLHTGAGVQGGNPAATAAGRAANLWESPNWHAALEQIGALQRIVPPRLAVGPRWNWHWTGHPCRISEDDAEHALVRFYAAEADGVIVLVAMGVSRQFSGEMTVNADVARYVPPFPSLIEERTIAAGDRLAFSGAHESEVILLRRR